MLRLCSFTTVYVSLLKADRIYMAKQNSQLLIVYMANNLHLEIIIIIFFLSG